MCWFLCNNIVGRFVVCWFLCNNIVRRSVVCDFKAIILFEGLSGV